MIIYNSVKKFRTEKNITQEELADVLEVSRQTIIAIEKGNYTPSLLLGLKLAEYFKVEVKDLFSLKKNQ